MQLNLDVKMTKTEQAKFIKYIQAEILSQMQVRINSNVNKLYYLVYDFVDKHIENSPEMRAIVADKLRLDLGIKVEEAEVVIDKIIDIINSDVKIRIEKGRDYIRVVLLLVERTYASILAIDEGHFTSINGFKIPWLEWLLLRGHEQVIKDFHVIYKTSKRSRSGGAFMVKSGSYNIIPSQYTGTDTDNFITRALDKLGDVFQVELDNIIS